MHDSASMPSQEALLPQGGGGSHSCGQDPPGQGNGGGDSAGTHLSMPPGRLGHVSASYSIDNFYQQKVVSLHNHMTNLH